MSGDRWVKQTVPPDTQMAEAPESGMEQEFNAIDSEGQSFSISPQQLWNRATLIHKALNQ